MEGRFVTEARVKELIADAVKDGGYIHHDVTRSINEALQKKKQQEASDPTIKTPGLQPRANVSGREGSHHHVVVIAPESLEHIALSMRKALKCDEYTAESGKTLVIDKFKTKDLNAKINWRRVNGRRVVMLFDTVDQTVFFEQLCVLQALQGFAVPHSSDKDTKWKTYVDSGSYSWGRASKITVVIPWYRPCQMERTCRWEYTHGAEKPWSNSDADGSWLDMPCALYYARLLSTPGAVPPAPGPRDEGSTGLKQSLDGMPASLNEFWRPPLELVFVELHEEEPVRHSVSDLNTQIRTARFVPFFLTKYREREMKNKYPDDKENMYVLFPDYGAHKRYVESVEQKLGLTPDHILFIEKSRVGESTEQAPHLYYVTGKDENGKVTKGEKTGFTTQDQILIIDDFTNSGGTLFGAVKIVHKMAPAGEGNEPIVHIFVAHLVAAYDTEALNSMRGKVRDLGAKCKFYCTNSIPLTTKKVLEWNDDQFMVCDLSEFICELVKADD